VHKKSKKENRYSTALANLPYAIKQRKRFTNKPTIVNNLSNYASPKPHCLLKMPLHSALIMQTYNNLQKF
jgi:hypothetical protein